MRERGGGGRGADSEACGFAVQKFRKEFLMGSGHINVGLQYVQYKSDGWLRGGGEGGLNSETCKCGFAVHEISMRSGLTNVGLQYMRCKNSDG